MSTSKSRLISRAHHNDKTVKISCCGKVYTISIMKNMSLNGAFVSGKNEACIKTWQRSDQKQQKQTDTWHNLTFTSHLLKKDSCISGLWGLIALSLQAARGQGYLHPPLNLEHSDPLPHQFIYSLTLNDSQSQWQLLAKIIFTRKSQKSGSASRLQHLLVTWESDDWRTGHAKSLDHLEHNLSSTE